MEHVDPRINLQDTFAQMPHKTASYGKYEVCFSSLAGLVHIGHGLVLAVYNLVVPGRHFFAPEYEDALTARHDVRPLQHLKLGMILLIPVIGSIVCWFFYYPTSTRERAEQYINLAQYLLETNSDVLSEQDGALTVLDNGAFLYEFSIEEFKEAGREQIANDCLREARSKFAELSDASLDAAQKQQILVVAERHLTLFPEGLGVDFIGGGQAAHEEGEGAIQLLNPNIQSFLQALNAHRQNPNAQPQPGGSGRAPSHNSLSEKSISSSSTESDEGRRTPPESPPPPPSGGLNLPRSFNSNPLSEDEKRRSFDRRAAAGVDASKRLSSNAALSLHTASVLRPNPPIPTPVPPARDASPTPSSSSTSSVLSSSVSSLLSKESQGVSLPRPPSGGSFPTFSLSSSSSALSSLPSLLSRESAGAPPPIPDFLCHTHLSSVLVLAFIN